MSQRPSRPRADVAAATRVWGSDARTEDVARSGDPTPQYVELDGVDLRIDTTWQLLAREPSDYVVNRK
jgi:hypothetical protein